MTPTNTLRETEAFMSVYICCSCHVGGGHCDDCKDLCKRVEE